MGHSAVLKSVLAAGVVALVCIAPAPAEVGISVNLGEPGFFGRLEIGPGVPPPQLVYRAPVVAYPVPGVAAGPPIYLHVRPGDERHWRRACHFYDACNEPVFFVRDRWYNDYYVRHYREWHHDERFRDEHRHDWHDWHP